MAAVTWPILLVDLAVELTAMKSSGTILTQLMISLAEIMELVKARIIQAMGTPMSRSLMTTLVASDFLQ